MAREEYRRFIPAACCVFILVGCSSYIYVLAWEGMAQFHASGGTPTTAVITQVGPGETPDTTGDSVTFQWVDSHHQPREGRVQVSREFSQHSATGQSIPIRYSFSKGGSGKVHSLIVGEELWKQSPYLIQGVILSAFSLASLVALVWMAIHGFQMEDVLSSMAPYFTMVPRHTPKDGVRAA